MATIRQNVTFFNFSGGLNTEASVVNIEPNDSTDLSNVRLNPDGSVERRKGADFIAEKGSGGFYDTITGDYSLTDEVPTVSPFTMTNSVGGIRDMVAVHIGTDIRLYEYTDLYSLKDVDSPIETFDLSSYGNTQRFYKTRFIQSRNRLYIVNKHIKLSYIELDNNNDFVLVVEDVFHRNLSQVGDPSIDTYVNDTYNHLNTWAKKGEDEPEKGDKNYKCIKSHEPSTITRPGIGASWGEYWVVNGAADPNYIAWDLPEGTAGFVQHGGREYECIKSNLGNATNEPGTGTDWRTYWIDIGADTSRFVAWTVYHGTLWGIVFGQYAPTTNTYTTNIEAVTFTGDAQGWRDGALSAGRLWLIGVNNEVNTVYFSQTIIEDEHHTRMYQFADPFNKYDSDTVDTDGGTITIADCEEIISIAPFRSGAIIFGSNGVWYIAGNNGAAFTATDFSVDKISDNGIAGRDCWTDVENIIIYFAVSGVYAIALPDTLATPQLQSLSSQKIDSFYNSIPLFNKSISKAVYNRADKKVYFFTNFTFYDWTRERNPNKQNTHTRDILVFDFKLQSWYKYSLVDDSGGTKVFIGDSFIVQGGEIDFALVTDNDGNLVEDASSNLVEALTLGTVDAEYITTLLLLKQNGSNFDFAFGLLEGPEYQDFSLNSVDTETVNCYINTAYQIFNDITHNKQIPYLTTIFKRVEENILDDDGIDINAGGCLLRASFNWADSSKSFKYGITRQAYLPNKWNIAYEDGSYPGVAIVRNKHRIRGRGNAIQLRFENDDDKPFYLYGWQMEVSISKKV